MSISNDNETALLTVPGVSRMADNDKAILVSFSRRLDDEELRFFHEVCQKAAPFVGIDA